MSRFSPNRSQDHPVSQSSTATDPRRALSLPSSPLEEHGGSAIPTSMAADEHQDPADHAFSAKPNPTPADDWISDPGWDRLTPPSSGDEDSVVSTGSSELQTEVDPVDFLIDSGPQTEQKVLRTPGLVVRRAEKAAAQACARQGARSDDNAFDQISHSIAADAQSDPSTVDVRPSLTDRDGVPQQSGDLKMPEPYSGNSDMRLSVSALDHCHAQQADRETQGPSEQASAVGSASQNDHAGSRRPHLIFPAPASSNGNGASTHEEARLYALRESLVRPAQVEPSHADQSSTHAKTAASDAAFDSATGPKPGSPFEGARRFDQRPSCSVKVVTPSGDGGVHEGVVHLSARPRSAPRSPSMALPTQSDAHTDIDKSSCATTGRVDLPMPMPTDTDLKSTKDLGTPNGFDAKTITNADTAYDGHSSQQRTAVTRDEQARWEQERDKLQRHVALLEKQLHRVEQDRSTDEKTILEMQIKAQEELITGLGWYHQAQLLQDRLSHSESAHRNTRQSYDDFREHVYHWRSPASMTIAPASAAEHTPGDQAVSERMNQLEQQIQLLGERVEQLSDASTSVTAPSRDVHAAMWGKDRPIEQGEVDPYVSVEKSQEGGGLYHDSGTPGYEQWGYGEQEWNAMPAQPEHEHSFGSQYSHLPHSGSRHQNSTTRGWERGMPMGSLDQSFPNGELWAYGPH